MNQFIIYFASLTFVVSNCFSSVHWENLSQAKVIHPVAYAKNGEGKLSKVQIILNEKHFWSRQKLSNKPTVIALTVNEKLLTQAQSSSIDAGEQVQKNVINKKEQEQLNIMAKLKETCMDLADKPEMSQINFVFMDAAANRWLLGHIAKKINQTKFQLPLLVFFKGGEVVFPLCPVMNEEQLKQQIYDHFSIEPNKKEYKKPEMFKVLWG